MFKRRKKLSKGERTKQLIIERTRSLFAKKGYDMTKTSEIAKACNLSEAAVYKYFHSKKDLLIACVTPNEEQSPKQDVKELSTESLIRVYVKEKINWIEKHQEQLKILLTESLHHHELSDIYVQQIDQENGYEKEIITRINKGEMKLISDFLLFRLGFTSSVLSILNHERISQKKYDLHFSDTLKEELTAFALYGLLGKK